MFVPIVPSVPHTTVINKTIVYSDTVLSLKDMGNNLIVTSLSNVNENSLETCLKIIFESNPNVVFNTVQYSKNDKKVYFYTNKKITTNVYEESKYKTYEPIASKTEILEEVKSILVSQKNKDSNCISLYEILMLLKNLQHESADVEKEYADYCEKILKSNWSERSSFVFHSFDYKNKTLHISFKKHHYSSSWDDMFVSKQNGDLYVVKSDSRWNDEVFSILNSALSEMYDALLKYADFNDYDQAKYSIKPVNSNFSVTINHHGVRIYTEGCLKNSFKRELELFAPSYKDGYELKCNSGIVNEAFNGKEREIFKRIFVKISDCPAWSQTLLYEIRENQLAEEQKIEDEIRQKEMKRQKRLEFTRKIFPFLK